jgi:hypothetical protein
MLHPSTQPAGLLRTLALVLPLILAACAPYTYNELGEPIPYTGSTATAHRGSDNCGTPDEPKRCPSSRPRPRVAQPQRSNPTATAAPDYN